MRASSIATERAARARHRHQRFGGEERTGAPILGGPLLRRHGLAPVGTPPLAGLESPHASAACAPAAARYRRTEHERSARGRRPFSNSCGGPHRTRRLHGSRVHWPSALALFWQRPSRWLTNCGW